MSEIRALIVEDDPFIAMDIESAVAAEVGADVKLIVVESVAEARTAAALPVACALLDIDVVGGQTFDVARSLLADGIPLAFVSGSAPCDVPKPLREVRFLRKPFSTREIATFVSRALKH